jgi:hypothetical protein
MNKEISNSDDVIDSRDVIARIDELTTERSDLATDVDDANDARAELAEDASEDEIEEADGEITDAVDARTEWDDDYGDELKALQALADEASDYCGDWTHGATLVRKSYFTDYCEELVKDIGDLPSKIPDYIVIDWEATAENLKADYTSVEFDGVTYLVR